MKLLQQLDRIAEASGEYCARRKVGLLCAFSFLYLLSTCLIAMQKPMWNDELFSFYIARLPNLSDIWSALLTGGEQVPPFFHIITRISLALFGVSELAMRLPEILGFWVMSLCLFLFVSKRSSALYGFAALLFPLVTKANAFAHEARPYGIILGLAALALLFWQRITEGGRRKLLLPGLAITLAAAVANHYYAVFLLVPLMLGEMTRSVSLRRIDTGIWAAMGFGLVPLIFYLPLMHEAIKQAAIFWARPHGSDIVDFYYSLLTPALLPIVVMLVVSGVHSAAEPSPSVNKRPLSIPPLYELAAAIGFTVIPLIAFIFALFVTGAMASRYILYSVIGFSILFAFAAQTLSYGRAVIGAAFTLSLFGGFVTGQLRNIHNAAQETPEQILNYEFLRVNSGEELPIVVSDLNTFTTLTHYAPPEIATRLVYLADPEASLRRLGHSSIDQGILNLNRFFKLRVEEFGPFIAAHERFLVYGGIESRWVWLLSELRLARFQLELKGSERNRFLFMATAGGDASSAAAAQDSPANCSYPGAAQHSNFRCISAPHRANLIVRRERGKS